MDLFNNKNIAPMLIAHNMPPFDNDDYIYELKLDGIRCLVYLDKDYIELRNKRGKNVTKLYPELLGICSQINKRCILDGEITVFVNGKPQFAQIQKRSLMTNSFKIGMAAKKLPCCFTAFDIIYLDSKDLTKQPLLKRKELLRKNVTDTPLLAVSQYIETNGTALYKAAEKQKLEGVVAKRKNSLYYFGKRTNEWIKIKALEDEDFVVCGYFFKGKNRISVIIGLYNGKNLIYQGHVVMGVSREDFHIMQSSKATSKEKLYGNFPDFDGTTWLMPKLVCTVQYMDRTSKGGLRQPVFKGLRNDKAVKDCITQHA